MELTKRQLIGVGGALTLAACAPKSTKAPTVSQSDNTLKSLTNNVPTIDAADHSARVVKAQKLMRQAGIKGLVLEAGLAYNISQAFAGGGPNGLPPH